MQGILRGGGKKAADKNARRNTPPADYRSYRLSLREWMVYGGEGIAFCALAAYVFYRSPAAFAVMAPLGMLYPLYKRRDLQKARLWQLNLQFKVGILVLSSFLSAGYSLENAFP